jgi:catechol 2,3-dioxygenase
MELARTLRRLAEARWPFQGFSDHGVSEAIYLADADGIGIEIYRDRPRREWPLRNGQLQMVTEPLDVDSLLAEVSLDDHPWTGLHPQTRMGHVHLHVANLREAEAFYCGILGFDLVQRYGGSALFVSAGGYHHHIGLNTWAGVGAPPPPPDSIGLRYITIRLPDDAERDRIVKELQRAGVATQETPEGWAVRDPSGNGIRLLVGATNPIKRRGYHVGR